MATTAKSDRAVAEFPSKLRFLFEPSRYKVLYGGRGGSKSWSIAMALLILGAQRQHRILCTRELQVSIKDSVHKLLKDQIARLGLGSFYRATNTQILGANGTEFIFAGIKHNVDSIKSTEGITIAWVEEAQHVSKESWDTLIPTVRADGSEIWVSMNPHQETDPTYQRFITNPPPDATVVEIGWQDNPWLSDALRREKDYAYATDPEAAEHVWGGKTRTITNANVLRGRYRIEAFRPKPDWGGPYYGADWGFSTDPTALVRCWVSGRTLFVDREAYGVGVDIDDTPALFRSVAGAHKHTIRADNARPETISYMKRHGFPKMVAVKKWPGSVEDGVEHLRSYEEIVIHPGCEHTAEEARLWSFKVDARTGDVLPVLVDKHNHCLVGETLVDTTQGAVRIDEMVGHEGDLFAFDGENAIVAPFRGVRMTSPEEPVYRLRTSDGRCVAATGDHPFLTTRGWVPMLALEAGDLIVDVSDAMRYSMAPCHQNTFTLTAADTAVTKRAGITSAASPTGSRRPISIETFGYTAAEISLRGTRSTTYTGTRRPPTLPGWSAFLRDNTENTTQETSERNDWRPFDGASRRQPRRQRRGIEAMRGGRGIANTRLRLPPRNDHGTQFVRSAGPDTEASSRDDFARTLASLLRADPRASMTFKGNVAYVGRRSLQTSIGEPRPADPASARLRWSSVVAVELAGVSPVYALEVPGIHTFTVAGGLVTHNCWDAIRYALAPMIRKRNSGLLVVD